MAGEFELSDSPYVTFDQGGNVWEWNETKIGSYFGLRGGSFSHLANHVRAFHRDFNNPVAEDWSVGFRVARIGNPASTGDFNRDGTADAADYIVWRTNPGGIYDQDDYTVWCAHFGQTAGSGAGASANTTVPEPATLVLLMLVIVSCCIRRGRAA